MRVPVSADIGGRKVSIKYMEHIPKDAGDEDESFGDTHPNTLQIRISTSKHKDAREVFSTLYHEIHHAALGQTGISALLKDELEEAIVTGTENTTAKLFCLNPDGPFIWRDVEFSFEE